MPHHSVDRLCNRKTGKTMTDRPHCQRDRPMARASAQSYSAGLSNTALADADLCDGHTF